MSKLKKLAKITISAVIILAMLLFALPGCFTYRLPDSESGTESLVSPTETAAETIAAAATTSDDGNDTNFYFVNHPVFIEEFDDFVGWDSQYGGATIDNGVLKLSGQDIENDGRSRDIISINKNLNTSVPRYWKVKARLSSEGQRAGTGFTMTLYYDTVIEKTIALNFDRSSIRGVESIFLIESGVDTLKENVIIETGFVPELDKWYEVEIYYTPIWSLDNSFSLKVNGTDIGSGLAPTEWMGSGSIKSDKITIWNENSVEIDYIEIYDVSREYKN